MINFITITLAILYHVPIAVAGKWPYGDKSDSAIARINCDFTTRKEWIPQFPRRFIGDSTEPPGINPNGEGGESGWMAFTGPECKIGIWTNGINNERSPGDRVTGNVLDLFLPAPARPYQACFPFRQRPSGECFNVDDNLKNQVSSFIVTGYCECEFFDDDNCQNTMFSAFNRADASLKTNGPHNDRVNSMKCWESKQLERFQMGTLTFYRPGKHGREIARDTIDPAAPEWNDVGGFSGCRVLAPEIEANGGPHKVKINGVSCMFFDNYECRQPAMFWEGSAGLAFRDSKLDGKVKSYRCFAPWGIGYRGRDDGFGPGPN
ncbi:hypothetical protein TWF281_007093 [Arthrobotrys megalospora]